MVNFVLMFSNYILSFFLTLLIIVNLGFLYPSDIHTS
jgi:hypothetical protein